MRCRRATSDVQLIVYAPKEALLAKVKRLLSRVRWNMRWKANHESAPSLPVFLMLADFLSLKPCFDEQEERGHIVPERIASEIQLVQFVPGGRQLMSCKRCPRVLTPSDDLSITVLNP